MKGIFTSTRSLACWAAFAVALIAAHSASAAFQITITAAGGSSGSLIIEDNNPSFPGPGIGFDSNVNLGEITFIGSVGGYQLIVTATQDAPSGTNGVGTLNVNVLSIRSTNVTGTLTIVATTDPYTFLVGQPGLGANALSNSSLAGSTLSGTTTYSDGTNTVVSPTVVQTSAPASSQSFFVTPPGTGSFTLTGTLVITNQKVGTVNATLSSSVAVPVPPAIALLASAAPVGLLALRRRRKTPAGNVQLVSSSS